MGDTGTTRKTYQELASHWRVSVPAAKARVRRSRWPRITSNDGSVTVDVPNEALREHATPEPVAADSPVESGNLTATLATLAEAHRETLQQLADTRDKLDAATAALLAEKDRTAELRVRIAELEATQKQPEPATLPPPPPESSPNTVAGIYPPRSLLQRILGRS